VLVFWVDNKPALKTALVMAYPTLLPQTGFVVTGPDWKPDMYNSDGFHNWVLLGLAGTM